MIDKNIPIPKSKTKALKEQMSGMEVGDSILIFEGEPTLKEYRAYHARCWQAAKALEMKVTISKTNEGIRAWRVK